jgi:hypothetical protein
LWIFSGRFEPWRGGRVKTLARGIISCDERARWAPTISRILYCLALNPSGAIFSFSMARWPSMRAGRETGSSASSGPFQSHHGTGTH